MREGVNSRTSFRLVDWRAIVLHKLTPRSYEVQTDNGYIIRHNRRAIRKDCTPECAVDIDPDLLEEELNKDLAMAGAVQTPIENNSAITDEHSGALPTPPMALKKSTHKIKRPNRLIEDM